MEQRLAAIEASLAAIERRLDALVTRLGEVEDCLAAQPPGRPAAAQPASDTALPAAPRAVADATGLLGLAGRSLIILGGAYLLRALTEGGTLPALVGVGTGLLYAFTWVLAGGRAARAHRGADATFHAIVATIVAFPLTVEATVRFGFLDPLTSAVSLAALSAPALSIAWYTRHQATAWCVTLGALGSAIAMIPMTGAVLPYAAFLLLLGLGTLWLGYDRDWTGLRWPVAFVADLVALGLVLRATSPEPRDPPAAVVTMLLALVAGYLASFAGRTLVRGRNVIPFEVLQTMGALMVGLGGAVTVVSARGSGVASIGVISLLLAGGSYAVAFMFVGRRQGLGVNFYFYTSLALVCTLVGLRLIAAPPAVALAAAALAAATTWLGTRLGRLALTLHGAIYAAQAVLASGLVAAAGAAYVGHDGDMAKVPSAIALLTLAAAVGCALAPRPADAAASPAWGTGIRAVQALLAAWCGGGAAIAGALALATTVLGRPLPPNEVAVTRTVVLSLAALLLASAVRAGRLVGASRLAYLVLLITGGQVLFEDLSEAGPGLLVVAFATYGLALIFVPRLARHRPAPPPEPTAA